MAEFAASLLALMQVADKVIRACSHLISATKDAPRDIVIVSSEVTSLRTILSFFGEADLHRTTAEAMPALFAPGGPIDACRKSIDALERLLPSIPTGEGKKRLFRMADLSWALKESEVLKLLAELNLHKSTLLLALTGNLLQEIKDIRAGVDRVEQSLSDAERAAALQWLQKDCHNPSSIHNRTFNNHEPHTNLWLHEWADWISWLQPDPLMPTAGRFLWIHGIPGSGKSVLASFIIEHVKTLVSSRTGLGYSFYYCHYTHGEDEGTSFLRWIVSHLSRQARWAPAALKRLHESGCDPTTFELLSILESVLQRVDTAYVVIDGIDESNPREQLLSTLITLASDNRFSRLHLLATSRLSRDIETTFSGISTNISMSNKFVDQDIRNFIHDWMARSPQMSRWASMAPWIEAKLCSGAKGMFRWVACQMQILERIREESRLLEALNDLPRDLDEIYTRVLVGVDEENRRFVRHVLLWIVGHSRSGRLRDEGIYADVLVSAVSDDMRHMTGGTYRYTTEDLMELCGCLITVKEHTLPFTEFLSDLQTFPTREGEYRIKRTSANLLIAPTGAFVTFAHYTVMEFLSSERLSASPAAQFSLASKATAQEFRNSVLRQALASDPTGTSTDWIRDREPYCLTLVPLIMRRMEGIDPTFFEQCIPYFHPASPHYPRIGRIQQYLATGSTEAQSFYMAQMPVYPSELTPPADHFNDPTTWAILSMVASRNENLARLLAAKANFDRSGALAHEVVACFIDGDENNNDKEGEAVVRTYRGTLWDVLCKRRLAPGLDVFV